jgi:hypothetical protein
MYTSLHSKRSLVLGLVRNGMVVSDRSVLFYLDHDDCTTAVTRMLGRENQDVLQLEEYKIKIY